MQDMTSRARTTRSRVAALIFEWSALFARYRDPALLRRVLARLLLAGLIDCAPLSDAIVMALPNDGGVRRQSKHTFDRFASTKSITRYGFYIPRNVKIAYRILMFLPPSIFVQILKTSSLGRTLRTAPQTSSAASANWSPIMAMSSSSQ